MNQAFSPCILRHGTYDDLSVDELLRHGELCLREPREVRDHEQVLDAAREDLVELVWADRRDRRERIRDLTAHLGVRRQLAAHDVGNVRAGVLEARVEAHDRLLERR